MDCFDVLIIVSAIVFLVVHLHCDDLVTPFELSHFNLYPKQRTLTSYLKLIL